MFSCSGFHAPVLRGRRRRNAGGGSSPSAKPPSLISSAVTPARAEQIRKIAPEHAVAPAPAHVRFSAVETVANAWRRLRRDGLCWRCLSCSIRDCDRLQPFTQSVPILRRLRLHNRTTSHPCPGLALGLVLAVLVVVVFQRRDVDERLWLGRRSARRCSHSDFCSAGASALTWIVGGWSARNSCGNWHPRGSQPREDTFERLESALHRRRGATNVPAVVFRSRLGLGFDSDAEDVAGRRLFCSHRAPGLGEEVKPEESLRVGGGAAGDRRRRACEGRGWRREGRSGEEREEEVDRGEPPVSTALAGDERVTVRGKVPEPSEEDLWLQLPLANVRLYSEDEDDGRRTLYWLRRLIFIDATGRGGDDGLGDPNGGERKKTGRLSEEVQARRPFDSATAKGRYFLAIWGQAPAQHPTIHTGDSKLST
ncbi:hypothetical protein B0H12DRAFT_1080877 [Mycena haematopus]|nr:hypothetical protein B0H12DRAFT_1080877 [Mycena haematopus]